MHDIAKLNVELINVTPELAKTLRETCHYERQRTPSDSHIDRLGREMEKGRFIPGTLIHLCLVGAKKFVVNGNHTLEAIIKSGVTVPLTFLYTECKDMHEVGLIYARHDAGRSRDWAAALRASGTYDAVGLDHGMTNAFAAAMKTVLLGFKVHGGARNPVDMSEINYSRDVRIDAMMHYKRYALQYAKCVAQADRRHQARLRRAAVMSVALETFRYQAKAAHDFWEGVARDDGLKRDDPRKTLVKYLLENTDQRNKERYKGPRAAAVAWNAFFTKEKLEKIQVPASFALLGTPWGAVPKGDRKAARKLMKSGTMLDGNGHGRGEIAIGEGDG